MCLTRGGEIPTALRAGVEGERFARVDNKGVLNSLARLISKWINVWFEDKLLFEISIRPVPQILYVYVEYLYVRSRQNHHT